MKKLISLVLVLVLMLSVAVMPVLAKSSKFTSDLAQKLETMKDEDVIAVNVHHTTGIDESLAKQLTFEECGIKYDEWQTNEERWEFETIYRRIKREMQDELSLEIFEKLNFTEDEIREYGTFFGLKLSKARIYEVAQSDLVHTIEIYDDPNSIPENDFLFIMEFLEQSKNNYDYNQHLYSRTYDELYYHYDENGELDWVLVYCAVMSSPSFNYAVFGDMVYIGDWCSPYKTGGGLYDVKENRFMDLCELDDLKEYDGLWDYLYERNFMYPIGDADNDRKLTVMDATIIQKKLAGIKDFFYDHYYHDDMTQPGHYFKIKGDLNYITDIDRDGKRTIMDATAIQLKLAEL